MRFQDKVVVITGAAAGIGFGIAKEFGEEGARVVIADIDATNGKAAEQRLIERGIHALYVPTDVSSEESVKRSIDQITGRFAGIDVLVNNAGIELWKGLKDLTADEWDRVLGVDLKGIFLMTKHAYPLMASSEIKSVVNISSNHAVATVPDYDAYAAAKGGVVSLTRSMALTLKNEGIRVNGICPGFIDTPMLDRFLSTLEDPAEYMNHVVSFHPVGRIGTPRDIGRICLFLASADAGFVNGQVIVADGGSTIQLRH